jgi:glyceraldehyde-3-phosphate dehydrogenase (NAD(P))
MTTSKVRVGVNGYGVIGKRVANAIRLQPDMELVGVSDVVSDHRIKAAVILGLEIYASVASKVSEMKEAGIPVAGTLHELLARLDVIFVVAEHRTLQAPER